MLPTDPSLALGALSPPPSGTTGALVLADGTTLWGRGLGAEGHAVGEVCFTTAMSGYQEVLTDPSFAGQIITFTFPHIGNVGTNPDDLESKRPAARGLVMRAHPTEPSNWRAKEPLEAWLRHHHLIGLSGIDTRTLTLRIRENGAPTGVIVHAPDGRFDLPALRAEAAAWPGLEGMDLAREVTCAAPYVWHEAPWGHSSPAPGTDAPHVVAIDYGAKLNILRCLVGAGFRVTVVPATTTADAIFALKPDGIFLSNGPGDPAATGAYAVPTIRAILERHVPLFGICLGHQMLALALGARTTKMARGHRGANHPVKDLATGRVEITSQNHGFRVLPETLPPEAEVTHVSLFDGSNEGLRLKNAPVFSVQYHPEASPGPHDSHTLFRRFYKMVRP